MAPNYNSYGGGFGYQNDPFAAPFNPINANPGNWSVDPFYLTPAYTAPYRPGYTGDNGYNAYDYAPPGYWGAMNTVLNPFGPANPKFSNPYNMFAQHYDAMSYNPVDMGAAGMQKYVVPGALSLGISYAGSRMLMRNHNPMTGGVLSAAARVGGRGAYEAAQAAKYTSVFTQVGDRLGRGLVGGSFGLFNRAAPSWLANGAGMMGGVASNLAVPYMMTKAATGLADTTFFDPYISMQENSRALHRNFSQTVLDPALSNQMTGRGISYSASARMGRKITDMATRDRTLEYGDYGMITDYGIRTGLLNNVSDESQITERIKTISNQVKLVMNIANEPSVKEAIDMIAKLRNSGVSQNMIPGVMTQLTHQAGMAGVSVQRMMNTVGMQGQMMAQQAGISPYAGQLMAGRTFAAFRAAERMGVLSPEMLAMLGGTEGATQSAMSGEMRGMQSIYGRMSLFNKYMGGNATKGPIETAGAFGQGFLKDPTQMKGLMALNQGMMAAEELKRNPNSAIDQTVNAYISQMPRSMFYNDKGELKAGALYEALIGPMNMSHEEARAVIMQRAAVQDPKTRKQLSRALDASLEEQRVGRLNQLGLANGFIGNTIVAGTRSARNAMANFGADVVGGPVQSWADASQGLSDWWQSAMYGSSGVQKQVTQDNLSKGRYEVSGGLSMLKNMSLGDMNHIIGPTSPFVIGRRLGQGRRYSSELEGLFNGEGGDRYKTLFDKARTDRGARNELSMVLKGRGLDQDAINDILGLSGSLDVKKISGQQNLDARSQEILEAAGGDAARKAYQAARQGDTLLSGARRRGMGGKSKTEILDGLDERATKAFSTGMTATSLADMVQGFKQKYGEDFYTKLTDSEKTLFNKTAGKYRHYSGLGKDATDSELVDSAFQYTGSHSDMTGVYSAMNSRFGGNTVESLMASPDVFDKWAKKNKMDASTVEKFRKAVAGKDSTEATKVLVGWTNKQSISEGLGDIYANGMSTSGGLLTDSAKYDLGQASIDQMRAVKEARGNLKKLADGHKISMEGVFQTETQLQFKETVSTFGLAVSKFEKAVDALGGRGSTQVSPTGAILPPRTSSLGGIRAN